MLEREPGTKITIFERRGSATPAAIELEGGAIFIEVIPGQGRTQIRTPHAIAAVRGTTYVVDVGPASTSVFVIKGSVTVRKADDPATVTLGPGQGVDVEPKKSVNVKTWGGKRVSALLARFGR